MDTARLNEIIGRYPARTGKILGILEQVQREFGYLPKDILKYLA
ncbi:MAG: NAD(P)H-dependent oxidoreductase subunit E, partial [Deltaproteobacteria bacterium]